jgi:hypothetical protein
MCIPTFVQKAPADVTAMIPTALAWCWRFNECASSLMVLAGDKDRDPTGCFLFPSLF